MHETLKKMKQIHTENLSRVDYLHKPIADKL